MIARMREDGTITLEPQNGAETVALKAWRKENRVESDQDESAHTWRGPSLEILVKEDVDRG